MASLLNSLLGQQDVPDFQNLSTNEVLGSIFRKLPKLQEINDQWNMDMATGGAKAQRAGEDIYDPNRGAIREAAGASLLDQVLNPFAINPQLANLWRQQGYEGMGGAIGEPSNAAQSNMFSAFGARAQDRADNILRTGLNYGANTANLYNPSAAVTPGDVGSMMFNQVAQQNAFNKYKSDLEFQNDMNLLNRPLEIGGKLGNIAGQIAGGVMGTNMGGGIMSAMGGMGGGGAPLDTQMWASPRGTQWNLPGGGSFTR